MKTPNRYCIQCKDNRTGLVGDFAYHDSIPFSAISPIFDSLVGFYEWMREHKLEHDPSQPPFGLRPTK